MPIVCGSEANFKTTTRDDLEPAEAVLSMRSVKAADARRPTARFGAEAAGW